MSYIRSVLKPLTGVVWGADSAAARWILLGLFGLGWLTVPAGTPS